MNQIKYLTQEKNMKQRYLSDLTGITEQRISKLKTYSGDTYMNKVYAAEYLLLDSIIKTMQR